MDGIHVTIYSIHGSYGIYQKPLFLPNFPCSFLEVQPPSSTRLLLGQLRIEGHQGVAARRRRSCLGFHWVYSGAPKRYKVVYKPSYKPY